MENRIRRARREESGIRFRYRSQRGLFTGKVLVRKGFWLEHIFVCRPFSKEE